MDRPRRNEGLHTQSGFAIVASLVTEIPMRKILFPALPTPADVARTLASYLSFSKKAKPAYVVFDKDGQPRYWSLKRAASERWGNAHLWDAFRVEPFKAAL